MTCPRIHSNSFNSSHRQRRIQSCCHKLCCWILSLISILSLSSPQFTIVEAAAASTFSGRRTIASASIRRPPSSSSSYSNCCFARPRNERSSRSTRRSSSFSSWPLLLLSSAGQSKCHSLGSYDELCDSLQQPQLEDASPPRSSKVILASSKAAAAAPRSFKKGGGNEAVVDRHPGGGVGGVSYDDLTPLGRCVYGSVEVAIVTLTDFVSGCFGGYMIGVVTDIPRLLFRSVEQQQQGATAAANLLQNGSSSSFWSQFSSRMGRMHGKSWRWGKEWGTISAVFGASRVATKVMRGGKEDEWSTVLSSMAAGAYFARKEGPQAMIKGALLYGGFVYLLSGNLSLKKKPFQYEEKPIDF